ncbi:Abi-alpha family protein [Gallibacterium sp. ZY190522]
MGNIKDISDVIKPESVAEIELLLKSNNSDLKTAGTFAADSKKRWEKSKNVAIRVLDVSLTPIDLLVSGFEGIKDIILDNILLLSSENQEILVDKIQRVVNKNIEISDLPTLCSATERLVYTQYNPDLKEMFENLIVNTIDKSKKSTTHPSFVEILKQFNSDDAYYFKNIFQKYFSFMDNIENDKDKIEMLFSISKSELYYRYKCSENDITSEDKLKDNTMYIDEKLGNEHIPEEVLDNWERLGLISVEREMDSLTDVGGQWIADVIKTWSGFRIVKLKKFGFNFAKAVSVSDYSYDRYEK